MGIFLIATDPSSGLDASFSDDLLLQAVR